MKDVYIRRITHNLFYGGIEYIYVNLKSNHEIISKNPDLLDKINIDYKISKMRNKSKIINCKFNFNKNGKLNIK